MPDTPLDISQDFEERHSRNMARAANQIKAIYEQAMVELAYSTAVFSSGGFDISLSPLIRERIVPVMREMRGSISAVVINSIKASWDISNQKNNLMMDKRLMGGKLNGNIPLDSVNRLIYDPNKDALEAFFRRREAGLNLSQRIWKSLQPFRAEMEAGLTLGIQEGESAASIARQLQRYLNEPDRLFRRIREIKGDPKSELKLSRAAKNYNPGQGMARSSYKNAERLAVTEVNMAYRSNDHLRWANNPLVKGIEVKLSNNHPVYDVCDSLVGIYPADYKHVGFHPRCRCFSVPIMLNEKEYEDYEDYLLGNADAPPKVQRVEDIHAKAKEWIGENAERIKGWKNTPYFLRDNGKYVNDLMK